MISANALLIICLFLSSNLRVNKFKNKITKKYEENKEQDSLDVYNKLTSIHPEIKIKERLIEIYKFTSYDASIYSSIILKSSERFDVEWEKITAKMKVESNFDPFIKSKLTRILKNEDLQRAYGLLQLKPKTAIECAKELNIDWNGIPTLYNPEINTLLGTYYFSKMEIPFKRNFEKAEKSYNVGLYGFYKGFASEKHWLKVSREYKKLKGLDFSIEEKKLKKIKEEKIQLSER